LTAILLSLAAFGAEVVDGDPVPTLAQVLSARTGVAIAIEEAPRGHLPTEVVQTPLGGSRSGIVRHPFPVELPPIDADPATVEASLNAHLDAIQEWEHWDGCTRYSVAPKPFGLAIRPSHAVVEGSCAPFESEVDAAFIPNDGVAPRTYTARQLSSELVPDPGVRIESGSLEIAPGGQPLIDALDALVSQRDGVAWYVARRPMALIPAVRIAPVGEVPGTVDIDIEALPHVPRVGPPPSLSPAARERAEEANRLMRRTTEECLATLRAAMAANPDQNPETLEVYCVDYLKEQPDHQSP
jgi:hypothetical protein